MNEPYAEGVAWIVRGARTRKAIITAPDRSGAGEAAVRLDRALDGFAGPVPPWFDFLHRTQNLPVWALFAVIGVVAAIALTPLETGAAFFFGLIAGVVVAAVLVKIAELLVHRFSGGKASAEDVIREVAPLARSAHYVVDVAATLVELDPQHEHEIHRLTWQAASADAAERLSGETELLRRLAELDPDEAADYEELFKEARKGR